MYSTDANASASYLSLRVLEDTLTSSPTANISAFQLYYKGVVNDIFFYGMCIVLPFGLLGNLFIIYVLLRSSTLRKTTTGQLLVALAIADIVVLIAEIFRWLRFEYLIVTGEKLYYFPSSLGLNFYDTSAAVCKITHFLRYSGSLWSAWITVAIAVERLIAVAWPLKITGISTPRRVQILIALIAFGGLALGLFPFWTVDRLDKVNGTRCKILNGTSYEVWNDIVIKSCTLSIPCGLITVLTVIIICLLYRARNRRKCRLAVAINSRYRPKTVRRISVETQMTIMLVAVCISTVALRTPYTVAYNVRSRFWYSSPDDRTETITYFAYLLTDLINIMNYAVNFLLYCLWGSSFRKECTKLLCCCRKDDQRPVKCLGVWRLRTVTTTLGKEVT